MRNWRTGVILAVSGCLVACTTETLEQSYQKPLVEPMTEGLRSFLGKPAQVAFSVLHYPDDQKVIADKKVYIWSTSQGDCVIRLFVDQSETVTNEDWRGSVLGCSAYIDRMRNASGH
jgi:hypothetical protein